MKLKTIGLVILYTLPILPPLTFLVGMICLYVEVKRDSEVQKAASEQRMAKWAKDNEKASEAWSIGELELKMMGDRIKASNEASNEDSNKEWQKLVADNRAKVEKLKADMLINAAVIESLSRYPLGNAPPSVLNEIAKKYGLDRVISLDYWPEAQSIAATASSVMTVARNKTPF